MRSKVIAVVVAVVVVVAAYVAGYWPERGRRQAAEGQATAFETQLAAAEACA